MTSKNKMNKYDKIMVGLGIWTSFYRYHPHRFGIEYFGMRWMRPFQQILINLIIRFTYCMIIASRGMGKSQIVAAAICIKCVLYPKTKVVISAGNRGQSTNVINKIVEEFMSSSQNLRFEVEDYKTTPSDSYLKFKNGSIVKIATARESARNARATWIVNDEFVQIKKKILDTVLRKFKAGQRTPNFYNKPEYKNYPKEPNCETYISSAYYKFHYSWAKFQSFFKAMVKGENYMAVGFPYQLPVSEGYYPEEQIREEMQEDDFDSIAWSMEMDSLFFGEASNAFYSFDDMNISRSLELPIYPIPYYVLLADPKIKYKPKANGEIRLIGMDIATQGGSKNDNTCFTVLQLVPISNYQYLRNVIYIETQNGGHTFDQAIRLRQLYDDLEVDFAIIDTNGVGIAVFDNLVKEIIDEDRNIAYEPWDCINDEKMSDRCKGKNAPKVIYSIKATQQFNSDAAVNLRDCLKRGKMKLLVNEMDANEQFMKNKYYRKLPVEEQALLQSPFYQTSMLINEMINLSYEVINGKIKVSEQGGMRKDRYSSCSYANAIASEMERDLSKPHTSTNSLSSILAMARPPEIY